MRFKSQTGVRGEAAGDSRRAASGYNGGAGQPAGVLPVPAGIAAGAVDGGESEVSAVRPAQSQVDRTPGEIAELWRRWEAVDAIRCRSIDAGGSRDVWNACEEKQIWLVAMVDGLSEEEAKRYATQIRTRQGW